MRLCHPSVEPLSLPIKVNLREWIPDQKDESGRREVMVDVSREVEMVAYYPIAGRSNLAYSAELADQPIDILLPVHKVTLRLPKPGESTGPREFKVLGRIGDTEEPLAFGTRAVESRVRFMGSLRVPSDAKGPLSTSAEFQQQLDEAESAAREAVARFRSWARLGQPWVGLSDDLLTWIEPLTVVDTQSGQAINCWPRGAVSGATIVGGPHLTSHDVSLIEDAEAKPPIEDQFLADARFLSHWSLAPAYSQAVISAAASCELKIKTALRDAARDRGMSELLDLMLGNPRAFPQAAHELFDSVARVILGTSLREHDPSLFKGVRKLFDTRNAIAHRGVSVGEGESGDLVRVAISVTEWIDGALINKTNNDEETPS